MIPPAIPFQQVGCGQRVDDFRHDTGHLRSPNLSERFGRGSQVRYPWAASPVLRAKRYGYEDRKMR